MHHNRQRVESCVYSRCRGHRHARAGLRGWNKPKRARKARADAQPEAAPPSTHSLSHHPGTMQNPDASYSQGHTRAGLQERNKQKRLTRKARAHAQPRASPASTHPARPSPSKPGHHLPMHNLAASRAGRRRRGSDGRRRDFQASEEGFSGAPEAPCQISHTGKC